MEENYAYLQSSKTSTWKPPSRPPSRSNSGRTPFLEVREGHAATISFNESTVKESPAHVVLAPGDLAGTMWCHTCVGFAWRLDKDRIFVAHINGWNPDVTPHNYVTPAQGVEIREQVFDRLKQECNDMHWHIEDPLFLDGIIGCCPWPTVSWDTREALLTGTYVVHGVADFIQIIAETLTDMAKDVLRVIQEALKLQTIVPSQIKAVLESAIDKEVNGSHRQVMLELLRRTDHAFYLLDAAERVRGKTLSVNRAAHGFIIDSHLRVTTLIRAWPSIEVKGMKDKVPREIADRFKPYTPKGESKIPDEWDFTIKAVWDHWNSMTDNERAWRAREYELQVAKPQIAYSEASREASQKIMQALLGRPGVIMEGDVDRPMPSIDQLVSGAAAVQQAPRRDLKPLSVVATPRSSLDRSYGTSTQAAGQARLANPVRRSSK